MPHERKHSTIWDAPDAPETIVAALRAEPEVFFAGFFAGSPEDLQINILLTLLEEKGKSETVLARRIALRAIIDDLVVAYGRNV